MEKTYKIICSNCKAKRRVKLVTSPVGKRIDWLEDKYGINHKIVSGRERLDQEMGWQCLCGNNDLMTEQEKRTFTNPAAPTPQQINDVVQNLRVYKPKFNMVEI